MRSVEFDTDAAHLSMYPNPNRGDALYLVIENLSEEATTAQVEIFDGMGKKVLSQQVAMGGGTLNTALSLGGDFGTGMYLVNVRVDGELFTERLIRE
ncbi:MAG: T9SS type A sorting domain-containing protein [Flavobacteriales bacterium]|nr:T9SS type A sorting domain-containing protein [Flavobacteriales bacterium]